jgi:lysophospholipase L1-like esterase
MRAAEPFEFRAGDRVALIGNTLIERAGRYGHIELALTLRHADKRLTFRNLGWSGDNVLGESRAYFGPPSDGYAHLLQYVDLVKPTVIVVGYGNSEAFEGKAGLDGFLKRYAALLVDLEKRSKRIIVLSPTPAENLGTPLPDMAPVNANRELYSRAIAKLAAERGYRFVDLFSPLRERLAAAPRKLTDNGIHFTAEGYAALAEVLDADLAGTASVPLVDPAQKEKLRKLIVEKDELFFHRYRPANETYLRGFRKHEQGQNAVEIGQFDPLVEKKENEIAELRKRIVVNQ